MPDGHRSRWHQAMRLFSEAVELDGTEREALLAGMQPDLRQEVTSLLAADRSAGDFLQGRPALLAAQVVKESGDLKALGPYRILRVIGQGGMGTVYEAEQHSPRRIVALKVIKAGLGSPEAVRRFAREAETMGRLQHPGIANIFDAGIADAGAGPQRYFAMEFVPGKVLVEFGSALPVPQRLQLFRRVCDAVQHAHSRGIIHRDLKPANILVAASGEPKILDFGVARITEADIHGTLQTDLGQLIGTLAYMSPEQTLGEPDEIDTRSDIYSLGVILYQLLSGKLPYQTKGLALHDSVRVIQQVDAAPLSSIDRTLRGDLETIVARAMEKDKTRRYASASELREDLRRYLADEPIVARPPTAIYQLGKLARRNKG